MEQIWFEFLTSSGHGALIYAGWFLSNFRVVDKFQKCGSKGVEEGSLLVGYLDLLAHM